MKNIKRIIIILLTLILLLTGCDFESEVEYLIDADGKDAISFLSMHESKIRNEYTEWDGSVLDFLETLVLPIPMGDDLVIESKFEMSGKYLFDFLSGNSYCILKVVMYANDYPILSVDCNAYVTDENKIYYENYRIGGVLISKNESNFIISTDTPGDMINTKKWMELFTPTEFLFALYDYSFEELADMGEKFYFSKNSKKGNYSCKVVHSPAYVLKEMLIDWKRLSEVFPDDYLQAFEIDFDDIAELFSTPEVIEEFNKIIKDMDYYTIYNFDSSNLSGATIHQKFEYEFDKNINATVTFDIEMYPLNSKISFDKGKFKDREVIFYIDEFFDGVNIEDYVGKKRN